MFFLCESATVHHGEPFIKKTIILFTLHATVHHGEPLVSAQGNIAGNLILAKVVCYPLLVSVQLMVHRTSYFHRQKQVMMLWNSLHHCTMAARMNN